MLLCLFVSAGCCVRLWFVVVVVIVFSIQVLVLLRVGLRCCCDHFFKQGCMLVVAGFSKAVTFPCSSNILCWVCFVLFNLVVLVCLRHVWVSVGWVFQMCCVLLIQPRLRLSCGLSCTCVCLFTQYFVLVLCCVVRCACCRVFKHGLFVSLP